MNPLKTGALALILLCPLLFSLSSCRTSGGEGSGEPSAEVGNPSPTGGPSTPTSGSGDPGLKDGEQSRQSGNEGEQNARNEGEDEGKDQGEQQVRDHTFEDMELSDIGEAVASAAEAVARAADSLNRAKDKMGDAEGSDEDGEDGSSSRGDEPNYDPFSDPTAGNLSDVEMAAVLLAKAAQTVREAENELRHESELQTEIDEKSKMSRREQQEARTARNREIDASEKLNRGSDKLETASRKVDETTQVFEPVDRDQSAREALSRAALSLMLARDAIIRAAVELGYLPEEALAENSDIPPLIFDDMQSMVEWLEMSVEILATVIDQGGLPDFSSPEFDKARQVLARQGGYQRGGQEREPGAIEGELDRTLSDYDEELAKQRRAMRNGSGEGAEELPGPAGGMPGGDGGDESGSVASAGGPEQGGDRPSSSSDGDGSNTSIGAGSGSPVMPEDLPDPQGDDVVARQLREAAMAETDPELRARLWEEYRNYRAATGN